MTCSIAGKAMIRSVAAVLGASDTHLSATGVHSLIGKGTLANVRSALNQLVEEGSAEFAGPNHLRRYRLTESGRSEYLRAARPSLIDDHLRMRIQATGDADAT